MSRIWMASALLLVLASPVISAAQSSPGEMSAIETATACAPLPRLRPSTPTALRVVGAQDPAPRTVFGPRDTVVVAGGTDDGVRLGQRYFVRRTHGSAGMSSGKYDTASRVTDTIGWVRIVSLNAATSLATVDHACSVLTAGDFLEPFDPPSAAAVATPSEALGELDFTSPGHIVFGSGERTSVGTGEFAIIDRGTDAGTHVGSRFAIYRDLRMTEVPLVSIGEAVVISDAEDAAVVRILRARDAVFTSDYLVPEKK